MNTSEVLNRAADLIEERGWRQGPAGWDDREGSRLCLEGGILAAIGSSFESIDLHEWFMGCPAYAAVANYLEMPSGRDVPGHDNRAIWRFNDEFGRTQAEVVETLRACAVIEASREREAAEVSA